MKAILVLYKKSIDVKKIELPNDCFILYFGSRGIKKLTDENTMKQLIGEAEHQLKREPRLGYEKS